MGLCYWAARGAARLLSGEGVLILYGPWLTADDPRAEQSGV